MGERSRVAAAAAAVWLAGSGAWLDRWQHARQGNRHYAEGNYEDAVSSYNQGLVDDPDSALLHFNLGAAQYKHGKYEDALKAFQQVRPADTDPGRTARVAYNAGNAAYKQGASLEGSQPQKAIEQWVQALVHYRRALGADPDDADAKFNYELVTKRIADLKKKLEEQKQQQEQQQERQDQQPPQDQPPQDQKDQPAPQDQPQPNEQEQPPPSDQQQQEPPHDGGADEPQEQPNAQPEQPPGDQQAAPEPQPQEPPADQPQEQAGGQQEPGDGGEGGPSDSDVVDDQKKDGEMSKREAVAVLDGQQSEEVDPSDIVKRMQGARVGQPAKDW